MSEGALSGVLVVAIEQAVAAPLCTVRLADAGARVIKIERPTGETARHYDRSVQGSSAYFVWLNRGKQSAALNLKAPADLALLHVLWRGAEGWKRNCPPGGRDCMGFSPKHIAPAFPRHILRADARL